MASEQVLYDAIVNFETQGVSDALNDAERVEKAISGIEADVAVDVTVDDSKLNAAKDIVDDIEAAAPNVPISADTAELEEAEGIIGRIKDALVGGAVVGAAGGLVTGLLGASGVGGLLEIDTALATIEGRTGRMIPGAEKLISNLYTDGWGESRQQIADTIVEASNLGIAQEDLAEATESAFQVASVTGKDTNEVLNAMDSLVKNGLVPSYSDAADVIVTGFQTGGDRGQDLLDTLNEYGSTFSELGLSGDASLSLITSGLQAGIDNSDRIADGLRVMRENLALVGTDENVTAAFEQLDSLSDVDLAGALDAYEAGTLSADEFFNGFFTALNDAQAVDPAAAQSAADAIIGTQATDFGSSRWAQLSTTAFAPIEGAAATSSEAIANTFAEKIDTFSRNVNEAVVGLLSSDAIDLDGKLEALKTGLDDALAVIQDGGSIEDAITVGLKPLGLDDEFQKLEAIFGNLVIGFLEIVAGVQDLLGKDSSGTRAEVTRLSEQQLAFDLQLTNPEDIAAALETASARGLTSEVIGQAVQAAVDTSLAENNLEQAQAIVQGLSSASTTVNAAEATYGEGVIASLAAAVNPAAAATQVAIPLDVSVDEAALQSQIAEAQLAAQEAAAALNAASPNPGGAAGGFFTEVEEQTAAAGTFWEQMQQDAIAAVTGTNEQLDGLATTAQETDTAVATAMTGNTVTASFEEVQRVVTATMLKSAAYVELFGRQVEEIDDKIASLLANMAAGFQSLSGSIAGAVVNFGAAANSSQTLNVNQTFNTTSDAQAAAAGNMTLDNLRGFS